MNRRGDSRRCLWSGGRHEHTRERGDTGTVAAASPADRTGTGESGAADCADAPPGSHGRATDNPPDPKPAAGCLNRPGRSRRRCVLCDRFALFTPDNPLAERLWLAGIARLEACDNIAPTQDVAVFRQFSEGETRCGLASALCSSLLLLLALRINFSLFHCPCHPNPLLSSPVLAPSDDCLLVQSAIAQVI
jgi:hypothetical protein